MTRHAHRTYGDWVTYVATASRARDIQISSLASADAFRGGGMIRCVIGDVCWTACAFTVPLYRYLSRAESAQHLALRFNSTNTAR